MALNLIRTLIKWSRGTVVRFPTGSIVAVAVGFACVFVTIHSPRPDPRTCARRHCSRMRPGPRGPCSPPRRLPLRRSARSGSGRIFMRLCKPCASCRLLGSSSLKQRKNRHILCNIMEWLNYHHLLYFWVVAKQGSIVAASEELRLAHPTISGQIHRLEDVLGEKLFARRGRRLVLTDAGRVALRYGDEIFSLGQEF